MCKILRKPMVNVAFMRQCPLKHKECLLKSQLVGRVVRSLEIQVANRQKNGSAEESIPAGGCIIFESDVMLAN